MLTIEEIKKTVAEIAPQYNLKKVALFGSRANGTAKENSDVDLLVEFPKGSSLFDLIRLKFKFEEIWKLEVDVIILIIEKEIELYAA